MSEELLQETPANSLGAQQEQPLVEEFTNLEHFRVAERAEQAVERSDFVASPEVRQALESYYQDHYTMAGLTESLLNQPLPTDEIEQTHQLAELGKIIAQSDPIMDLHDPDLAYQMRSSNKYVRSPRYIVPALAVTRMNRIADPSNEDLARQELDLSEAAVTALFSEASIGVTTIGEQERQTVIDLYQRVKKAKDDSGLYTVNHDGQRTYFSQDQKKYVVADDRLLEQNPLYYVEQAQKSFWADTRFAGQLLFHNTPHFDRLRASGMLAPRRVQERLYGRINRGTVATYGEFHHSPTIHWSENYDKGGYKGAEGSTIAVPIGKVVEVAPYARDAQYGTVVLKPEKEASDSPRVTINDGVSNFSTGENDVQGASGGDRTFYASPHDIEAATDFAIRYDAGKVWQIDTAISSPGERIQAGPEADAQWPVAPDGYVIEINEHTTWVPFGKEQAKAPNYGAGEHWPKMFPIAAEDIDLTRFSSEQEREELMQLTADRIRELQQRSIKTYPGVVVPLRAVGVIEFQVHDDAYYGSAKPQAQFHKLPQAA